MSLGPSQVEATVDVAPFDLEPQADVSTGAAALCLHGLTGTPYEVRPVAEALAARGVRARGIWMAGHNGTVDDLAATRREDWLDHAREAFHELRRRHDRVFLVGVSMGGLVSLRLAQTESVEGVVVVGVPIELGPPVPQLLPLLRLFIKAKPKGPSNLQDPEAAARHPHFPAMPLDSVRELIRLGREVERALPDVTAPILVAHGRYDTTARPRDAKRIYEGVGTSPSDKELFLLERSGHVATVDFDGPALCRAAADFLSRR